MSTMASKFKVNVILVEVPRKRVASNVLAGRKEDAFGIILILLVVVRAVIEGPLEGEENRLAVSFRKSSDKEGNSDSEIFYHS